MNRLVIHLLIALAVVTSIAAFPSIAVAQTDPGPGEGEPGEPGEGGEAPDTLPVTGGMTPSTTFMVVLAVLGLLLAGAFATRASQRNA